jgi:predicted dehydrogenase
MTPEATKILMIGCGAVTRELYVPALRRLAQSGDIQVAGLFDPEVARATAVQRQFRDAVVYKTIGDALTSTADMAIIASPPAFHATQAIMALERGLHVLCEKPMALSNTDCEAMITAAQAAGRKLQIGLPRRTYPVLRDIQHIVANRSLGPMLTFHYYEGGRYSWPVASTAAFQRSSSGGGVLMDKGSHALDVLLAIFGTPDDLNYSDDALAGGVETNCVIRWNSPEINGTVTLSWDQDLANGLRISGEQGELIWDIGSFTEVTLRMRGEKGRVIKTKQDWPAQISGNLRKSPRNYFDCVDLAIVHSIRAIYDEKPSILRAETAAISVAMIEHCYKSASLLPLPWLPTREQATYRRRHWAAL